MASEFDASCENDPNFAIICAFLEKFGKQCGLPSIDFLELQQMLENSDEVPLGLTELIIKLLRKVKKTVKPDKWEKSLIGVTHTFSSIDAWEIERFGYKKAKLTSKVRVLKELLEMQFDHNVKFKNEINKLNANDLRSQPLGRDKAGHAYWFHSGDNYQIRIYKEDLDDETWKLIAKDRESLVSLINKLNDGDTKFSSDSAVNEDSSSLSDKPVIDTGQSEYDEETTKDGKVDENNDTESNEKMKEPVQIENEPVQIENEPVQIENEPIKNGETNSDQIVRPMLRIKKLSELMETGVKRQRFEEDSEDTQDKVLKVHLTNFKKEIIVGETISEPLMIIEGEGTGKDNQSICATQNGKYRSNTLECDFENYSIIGEEIEEETFYVYGEGLGQECLTGNEEKTASTSDKNLNSNLDAVSSSDSLKDSIKCTVSELKDNNIPNEVPSTKLDMIIDKKTDNNLDPSSKDLRNSDELDNKIESADSSRNESMSDGTKSPVPKKSVFFFGSPLKNTSFSPSAKVEFGHVSPQVKEVSEAKLNSENNNEIEKGKENNTLAESNEKQAIQTDNIIRDESKQNEIMTDEHDERSEKTNSDVTPTGKEIIGSSENISSENSGQTEMIKKDETLEKNESLMHKIAANKINNEDITSDVPQEVREDPCIKEVAYQCGTEQEKVLEEKSTDGNNDVKDSVIEKLCEKEVAYKCGTKEKLNASHETSLEVTQPDEKTQVKKDVKETTQLQPDLEKSKIEGATTVKSSDSNKSIDGLKKIEKSQNKTVRNMDEVNKANKIQAISISKTSTTIKDDQLHKSLRYFRTRRTANVKVVNAVKPVVKNNSDTTLTNAKKFSLGISVASREPKVNAEITQKVPTEVVYVQDRKIRVRKEREIMPLISLKNNKKPKLISDELDQETSQVPKKDDKPDPKTSSSISSPLSVTDSVITFPDSLENSCADVPEKDPLAESDVEDKPEPKSLSLRSLSFDYNDSSTPPVPVVSFKRVLRKRGREASPEPAKTVISDSKKMKFKGRRQINMSLRKSIEEKKEQHVSSSDEVQVVSEIKSSKKTPKKKQKAQSKKQKQKKQVKSIPETAYIEVSDDNEISKNMQHTKKKVKHESKVKKQNDVIELSDEDSLVTAVPKPRPKGKNIRILAGLEIQQEEILPMGVRQSRRLAQIKIKEQVDPKRPEPKSHKQEKLKKNSEKETAIEKRKRAKAEEVVATPVQESQEKKKKRRKEKSFSKSFDERKIWQSSSESSEVEEEVEEEEDVIEDYEPTLEFKSDHEFSPESDIGSDGECQPLKRARTARKNKESDREEEDFPCQKCGKSDHPEWILLCDKCDNGWHCSCLRPPLLNIPEGDWHCPPCQHILLVGNLQKKLGEYEKQLNKKVLEDRRKERLAYVGISLNNVLPTRENEHRKKKRRYSFEESEESGSERSRFSDVTESDSDTDEPIYQLRQRRQAKSYKFNEYDELINSAIQEEMEEIEQEKATQSRGKDIATIVRAEEEERKEKNLTESKPEAANELIGNNVSEINKKEYSDDDEPIRPPVKRGRRKKGRKMTNLDLSSEGDDEKDEDFKGSSSSSEEEDIEEEESDDGSDYISGKRRKNLRPVRRSTRVKTSRYDADFINDDDEDDFPRKKKKKQNWSESESSDTDGSWWNKKKKGRIGHIKKRKHKKKNTILDELSDLEIKRKPKIKYGGLTSSEEDTGRRRTRGKKTTYVDTLGSDSEEERKKRNPHRYIDSDDENDEDFIANEEEEEKDSEKDSEEPPEEDKEEEQQEERRPLVIPKIYIKKPPICKDILPPQVNSGNKEHVIAVEKSAETVQKDENKFPLVINQENEGRADSFNNFSDEPKIECANIKKEEDIFEPVKKLPEKASIEVRRNSNDTENNLQEDLPVKIEPQTEVLAIKQAELTALEIEQEKKRKALEEAKKLLGHSNSIEIVSVKRGRKPIEEPLKIPLHEPIVSNVNALILNDESNDELSEPPSLTLPIFEELANKNGTGVRRKIGKGRPKKTLEEAVANLGGSKTDSPIKVKSESELCIEIAAPPQPFSQASPVPSVITRMLQTSPGQTTAFPVGKIRPKQFATMPADDDDEPLPNRSRGNSPQTGPYSSPHMGQFLPGGPRGPVNQPYGQMHPNINPYPRSILPPHQARNQRSAMGTHMYPSHRIIDSSPSGGGPLNMSEPPPQHLPSTSASNIKVDSQIYSRSPSARYPPISTPSSQARMSPRPTHNIMSHMPRPANMGQYPQPPTSVSSGAPPANYYGGYPPESMANEDAMPPSAYQGSPYQEEYAGEAGPEATENSSSKSYSREAEETGGEFGGLVSYFSSQREDDLDS